MKIVPLTLKKTGENKLHNSRKGLTPADVDTFFRYDIEIPESALELRLRFTHSPKIITSPEENRRAAERSLTTYAADFNESFDSQTSERSGTIKMGRIPKRQPLVVTLLNGVTYRSAVDARCHTSAP